MRSSSMMLLGFVFWMATLAILQATPTVEGSFVAPRDFATSRPASPQHNAAGRRLSPSRRTTTRDTTTTTTTTRLLEMKRPILDQIATTLFRLENDRVAASSVADELGRIGEPMEWSQNTSAANRFSEMVANNAIGYQFKQWVADIVAGSNYDRESVQAEIERFIQDNEIAMYSFTTCPFCRRAKDALDERGISYAVVELDELKDNEGNAIRAELGRKTKRTSVPSIFVRGQYIGGCNDGPGLLPLMESGEFDRLLQSQN